MSRTGGAVGTVPGFPSAQTALGSWSAQEIVLAAHGPGPGGCRAHLEVSVSISPRGGFTLRASVLPRARVLCGGRGGTSKDIGAKATAQEVFSVEAFGQVGTLENNRPVRKLLCR